MLAEMLDQTFVDPRLEFRRVDRRRIAWIGIAEDLEARFGHAGAQLPRGFDKFDDALVADRAADEQETRGTTGIRRRPRREVLEVHARTRNDPPLPGRMIFWSTKIARSSELWKNTRCARLNAAR